MTHLLFKLIKNSKDTQNPTVRRGYITLGSAVGIACNILLFVFKLLIGILSGSVSILADAFNNLSDIGSSVVTVIGYRLSEKPADKEHPFGHGRIEYMSAMIVSFLIILVGVELLKSSFNKIINPTDLKIEFSTLFVLVFSILVKFWMFIFNRKIGKTINSTALVATARDSINDSISTSAVLIAVIINLVFKINLDAYIGLGVAAFIIYSGIITIKEALDPLLGQPPSNETINSIVSIINSYDEFLGIHDLIVHDYGPGRSFASLHVEVPSNVDIVACHETIDACEKRLLNELNMEVVIHMDPIVTDDEYTLSVSKTVCEAVISVDNRLTVHDFRMVGGEKQINLIFDVVIPNDLNDKNEKLKAKIDEKLKAIDNRYETVITFDRDYISRI